MTKNNKSEFLKWYLSLMQDVKKVSEPSMDISIRRIQEILLSKLEENPEYKFAKEQIVQLPEATSFLSGNTLSSITNSGIPFSDLAEEAAEELRREVVFADPNENISNNLTRFLRGDINSLTIHDRNQQVDLDKLVEQASRHAKSQIPLIQVNYFMARNIDCLIKALDEIGAELEYLRSNNSSITAHVIDKEDFNIEDDIWYENSTENPLAKSSSDQSLDFVTSESMSVFLRYKHYNNAENANLSETLRQLDAELSVPNSSPTREQNLQVQQSSGLQHNIPSGAPHAMSETELELFTSHWELEQEYTDRALIYLKSHSELELTPTVRTGYTENPPRRLVHHGGEFTRDGQTYYSSYTRTVVRQIVEPDHDYSSVRRPLTTPLETTLCIYWYREETGDNVTWQDGDPSKPPPEPPPPFDTRPWNNEVRLLPSPVTSWLTSDWGWRSVNGGSDFHPGIDVAAPPGTAVMAIHGGTVTVNRTGAGAKRGIHIISGNTRYVYWHIEPNPSLNNGDTISPGDPIGTIISWPGNPNRSHVHHAIYEPKDQKDENSKDPLK